MPLTDPKPGKRPATDPTEVDGLKKLIRKLRWIGLEQEAEIMCSRLSRIAPLETRLIGPQDTD